jgi:glycosyltransferase involved in cell wall biosynthesis
MVLLLTNNFPPYVGGSSQILYELLRHFPSGYFRVYHGVGSIQKNETVLPFKRKQLTFFNSLIWTQRIIKFFPIIYSLILTFYIIIKEDKKKCSAIYAHYPSAPFLISAYFLSCIYKKPLIIYYDIVWEGRGIKSEDKLAKIFEHKILKRAVKVITITEFLAKHLEDKYNIKCIIIPHTTSEHLRNSPSIIQKSKKETDVFKIHFAGAIYPRMNQDSILRLAKVLNELPFNCEMELCSPNVPSEITEIFPVTKRYLNHEQLLETQINSDLLFLPQAFESDSKLMIELNMPTKAMEYVCTGIPILVHSPKNTYLTWLAKQEKFANVVDTSDENSLKEVIMIIKNEKNNQKIFLENAKKLAQVRDSKIWSEKLKKHLEGG